MQAMMLVESPCCRASEKLTTLTGLRARAVGRPQRVSAGTSPLDVGVSR
jgi:hypothetical protein